jgi:hypothetical protein
MLALVSVEKETYKQKPGFKTVVKIKAAVEVKAVMCQGCYQSVKAAVDYQG